ncbi:MAG: hypothetical protein ACK5CH_07725, partial [Bacteroidota bacterium]
MSAMIRNIRTLCLGLALLFASGGYLSAQTVTKQLYLSDGPSLDRIDPVASADATTASTVALVKSPVTFVTSATVATSNSGSSSGSLTSSAYTVAAGSDRLLVVSIGSSTPLVPITGVTFNGTPLTRRIQQTSGTTAKVELWYLVISGSAAVTGNVVATWASGTLEGTMAVSNYTGVNPSNPINATASQTGTNAVGGTISLPISTNTGDLVIDAIAETGNAPAPGTGQTAIVNGGTNSVRQASSYKTAAGTSTTMSWSSFAGSYVTVAIALDGGGTTATWNQSPAMCSPLTIPANSNITITGYYQVTSGTMPSSLAANAVLMYDTTRIVSLTSATASATGGTGTVGTLTWSGSVGASPVTIPANKSLTLVLSNENTAVQFQIDYDSNTKPSKIDIPTSTYINVNSFDVYTAAYPGGTTLTLTNSGTTVYPRAVVSDPFGSSDINGVDITFTPGGTSAATLVNTNTGTCTRTYEFAWTPSSAANYSLQATAKEGLENTVTHSKTTSFSVCPITVSASMTTAPTCASPSSGVITYSVSDGAGPYMYSYSGTSSGSGSGTTISSLTAGTYNITVTSAAGCTGTASVVVTPPSYPSVSGVVTNVACMGASTGAINITVTGGTGAITYNWGSGVTTEDRTALAAGTYTVTVTDASSCTTTSSFTVTEPATLLAVVVDNTTNLTCNGSGNGVINITASNGGTSYTYLWSDASTAEDRTGLA